MGSSVIITILSCVLKILLIVNLSTNVNALDQLSGSSTCGYSACPVSDKNKLNIHLVPHTHDDVGWLKTVDQYYEGTDNAIHDACVHCILDRVVDQLLRNPTRRFIYVETAFLWRWWNDQNQETKRNVRMLIEEGRLEIIGGGWSMNDEAVTHYQSIIDQLTWGFRRLNDTFGSCARPKIGWQIDTFGHSQEQASIFAQMGFDGLFFARIDYKDRAERERDKRSEFIWRGSPNLGESSDLFTSILYKHYNPPKYFCFDLNRDCSDQEIDDNPRSTRYNAASKAEQLLIYAREQAKAYRTKNVLITMGNDFTYEGAYKWFESMDKLINYINKYEGYSYKIFYSTPSCYLKSVNEQNLTWSEESGDFFPYASSPKSYWAGYYTSRPTLKYSEKMGNNFLQIVKQLRVLTNERDSEKLESFREIMGVLQHHDAITGTEKQHVAEDYKKNLFQRMNDASELASEALERLTQKKQTLRTTRFKSCLQLNISSCTYSYDNDRFVVTVYNPTSQHLTTYVRLPVQESLYTVQDYDGLDVITQYVPIPEQVLRIPGQTTRALKELIFKAENIPPLGFQSFYVQKRATGRNNDFGTVLRNEGNINNEHYRVSVQRDNRIFVESLGYKMIKWNQSFGYYNASQYSYQVSGAYIFRPQTIWDKIKSRNASFEIYKGPLVNEIHHVINDWVSQVVRIYDDTNHVEFNWLVGPIPTSDFQGKEIVVKYTSDFKTDGEFYTDSNSRGMLKRKLKFFSSWDSQLTDDIAHNYYPITSKITIEDKRKQTRLSVLTDRAEGGSSLSDGNIELMVHRALLLDDNKGVAEALDEHAYGEGVVVRGQHFVTAGDFRDKDELILREKELAIQASLKPWIFITPTQMSFTEWKETYEMKSDDWIRSTPPNVRILTLEPWKDGSVLLRLEHFFEKNEASKYSGLAKVELRELFAGFIVNSVEEMSLGANQRIEDVQRMKWRSSIGELRNNMRNRFLHSTNSTLVRLEPMQIKTFIVRLTHKFDKKLRVPDFQPELKPEPERSSLVHDFIGLVRNLFN
ncbi:hypothetical protein QAD02_010950 [Eretmocerus hayati]|uniref:Uncharacterized protein n=1 Tax=Eretmocerus hayati TaxID=131215 RepID=A0ACC2NVN4_9HYME|nr:hypothetical protein QAD02_010950 [Eretmocerus hayati]